MTGAHHPRSSADPLRPHRHAPRGANSNKNRLRRNQEPGWTSRSERTAVKGESEPPVEQEAPGSRRPDRRPAQSIDSAARP